MGTRSKGGSRVPPAAAVALTSAILVVLLSVLGLFSLVAGAADLDPSTHYVGLATSSVAPVVPVASGSASQWSKEADVLEPVMAALSRQQKVASSRTQPIAVDSSATSRRYLRQRHLQTDSPGLLVHLKRDDECTTCIGVAAFPAAQPGNRLREVSCTSTDLNIDKLWTFDMDSTDGSLWCLFSNPELCVIFNPNAQTFSDLLTLQQRDDDQSQYFYQEATGEITRYTRGDQCVVFFGVKQGSGGSVELRSCADHGDDMKQWQFATIQDYACASDTLPPTRDPTEEPTDYPSAVPSAGPTIYPSAVSSAGPTMSSAPTVSPQPSLAPSISLAPTVSSPPSENPSLTPSLKPSIAFSAGPSIEPTGSVSMEPSVGATDLASASPSVGPSLGPSGASMASSSPSMVAVDTSTDNPSLAPTSSAPSLAPTSSAPSLATTSSAPSLATTSSAPSLATTSSAPSLTPSLINDDSTVSTNSSVSFNSTQGSTTVSIANVEDDAGEAVREDNILDTESEGGTKKKKTKKRKKNQKDGKGEGDEEGDGNKKRRKKKKKNQQNNNQNDALEDESVSPSILPSSLPTAKPAEKEKKRRKKRKKNKDGDGEDGEAGGNKKRRKKKNKNKKNATNVDDDGDDSTADEASDAPSVQPSVPLASTQPSAVVSVIPSASPSSRPSPKPSVTLSAAPSARPSLQTSFAPSAIFSSQPSKRPSAKPTIPREVTKVTYSLSLRYPKTSPVTDESTKIVSNRVVSNVIEGATKDNATYAYRLATEDKLKLDGFEAVIENGMAATIQESAPSCQRFDPSTTNCVLLNVTASASHDVTASSGEVQYALLSLTQGVVSKLAEELPVQISNIKGPLTSQSNKLVLYGVGNNEAPTPEIIESYEGAMKRVLAQLTRRVGLDILHVEVTDAFPNTALGNDEGGVDNIFDREGGENETSPASSEQRLRGRKLQGDFPFLPTATFQTQVLGIYDLDATPTSLSEALERNKNVLMGALRRSGAYFENLQEVVRGTEAPTLAPTGPPTVVPDIEIKSGNDSDSKPVLSLGAIIGIAVGGAVALIGGGIGLLLWRRRVRKHKDEGESLARVSAVEFDAMQRGKRAALSTNKIDDDGRDKSFRDGRDRRQRVPTEDVSEGGDSYYEDNLAGWRQVEVDDGLSPPARTDLGDRWAEFEQDETLEEQKAEATSNAVLMGLRNTIRRAWGGGVEDQPSAADSDSHGPDAVRANSREDDDEDYLRKLQGMYVKGEISKGEFVTLKESHLRHQKMHEEDEARRVEEEAAAANVPDDASSIFSSNPEIERMYREGEITEEEYHQMLETHNRLKAAQSGSVQGSSVNEYNEEPQAEKSNAFAQEEESLGSSNPEAERLYQEGTISKDEYDEIRKQHKRLRQSQVYHTDIERLLEEMSDDEEGEEVWAGDDQYGNEMAEAQSQDYSYQDDDSTLFSNSDEMNKLYREGKISAAEWRQMKNMHEKLRAEQKRNSFSEDDEGDQDMNQDEEDFFAEEVDMEQSEQEDEPVQEDSTWASNDDISFDDQEDEERRIADEEERRRHEEEEEERRRAEEEEEERRRIEEEEEERRRVEEEEEAVRERIRQQFRQAEEEAAAQKARVEAEWRKAEGVYDDDHSESESSAESEAYDQFDEQSLVSNFTTTKEIEKMYQQGKLSNDEYRQLLASHGRLKEVREEEDNDYYQDEDLQEEQSLASAFTTSNEIKKLYNAGTISESEMQQMLAHHSALKEVQMQEDNRVAANFQQNATDDTSIFTEVTSTGKEIDRLYQEGQITESEMKNMLLQHNRLKKTQKLEEIDRMYANGEVNEEDYHLLMDSYERLQELPREMSDMSSRKLGGGAQRGGDPEVTPDEDSMYSANSEVEQLYRDGMIEEEEYNTMRKAHSRLKKLQRGEMQYQSTRNAPALW